MFLILHRVVVVVGHRLAAVPRGCVFIAANKAHHSLPLVAGTPTAARPSPMCFALCAAQYCDVDVTLNAMNQNNYRGMDAPP